MLAEVSGKLGFNGPEFLEANVLQMWANGELPIPAEVTVVQDFLKQL